MQKFSRRIDRAIGVALVVVTSGVAGSAAGAITVPADTTLIAGYEQTIEGQTVFIAGETARAVGFTMPAGSDYFLGGAILQLNPEPFGADGGAVDPHLALFRGALEPTDQVLVFDDPAGDIALGANTFTSPSSAVLEAGVRYWLVLDNRGIEDSVFGWLGTIESTPAFEGIVASDTGTYLESTIDNGNLQYPPTSPIAFQDTRNAFAVYGTEVPEPATLALLGLGGVAALARRHRSSAR